ncbi:MAG TPA: caspase family protein [Pseudonocardiaceae bacterium]|jgi:hypothetical protein|nr:caspase family protein [Pseudonocardiaceae bacterium]
MQKDTMPERRMALLIATDTYTDPTFSKLDAPQADAEALKAVLCDRRIGNYQVGTLHNAAAHEINKAVEALFAEAGRDDLLLLYFSGHGVKDDAGRLHLITNNSDSRLLASTAVSAVFVRDQMDRTKSRRVIVLLDCCYAGAFPPGTRHRAGGHVEFPQLKSRGRAVITSSSELEYSYEASGNPAATMAGQSTPSVFTGALVRGLQTGDADLDGDGLVEVNELYDYVYQQVRAKAPQQNPQRKFELEGTLYLANSGRRPLFHGLPEGIAQAIRGPHRRIRQGAVSDLIELAHSPGCAEAHAARRALLYLTGDSDSAIRVPAANALRSLSEPHLPTINRPPSLPPSDEQPTPGSSVRVAPALAHGSEPLPGPPLPSHRDRPPQARRLPIVPEQEIPNDPVSPADDPVSQPSVPDQPLSPVNSPVEQLAPAARRNVLAALSTRWGRGRTPRPPRRQETSQPNQNRPPRKPHQLKATARGGRSRCADHGFSTGASDPRTVWPGVRLVWRPRRSCRTGPW